MLFQPVFYVCGDFLISFLGQFTILVQIADRYEHGVPRHAAVCSLSHNFRFCGLEWFDSDDDANRLSLLLLLPCSGA